MKKLNIISIILCIPWLLSSQATISFGKDGSKDTVYIVQITRDTVFAIGPQGLQGIQGIPGTDGADGAIGPQGPQGIAGTDGVNGADGATGATGAQGVPGTAGLNGINGINCWDKNGNGINDPSEDINTDGQFDANDCIGATGATGAQGIAGTNGTDGAMGATGAQGIAGINGLACWDTNANGTCEPSEAGANGTCGIEDCQVTATLDIERDTATRVYLAEVALNTTNLIGNDTTQVVYGFVPKNDIPNTTFTGNDIQMTSGDYSLEVTINLDANTARTNFNVLLILDGQPFKKINGSFYGRNASGADETGNTVVFPLNNFTGGTVDVYLEREANGSNVIMENGWITIKKYEKVGLIKNVSIN